jgi:hypothetical protein
MTHPAPSFAPRNALKTWTDGRYVYAEIPGKGLAPATVFKCALHEGGLWKLLNLLRDQRWEYAGEPMVPPVPKIDPKGAKIDSILRGLGLR